MTTHKYEELSAHMLVESLQETSLVYFPVGSMEFHGPHLPLGLDTIHIYNYCLAAVEKTGGVVLPPTYWNANGHVGYPGSMLVRESTFRAIVRDVFDLLADNGVKLVVASTGHWPSKQGVTIARLAREATKKRPETKVIALEPFGCHPSEQEVDHAGELETALMLAVRPDLVHMEMLDKVDDPLAGIGKDTAEGTAERGQAYLDASLACYVETVKETLAELSQ